MKQANTFRKWYLYHHTVSNFIFFGTFVHEFNTMGPDVTHSIHIHIIYLYYLYVFHNHHHHHYTVQAAIHMKNSADLKQATLSPHQGNLIGPTTAHYHTSCTPGWTAGRSGATYVILTRAKVKKQQQCDCIPHCSSCQGPALTRGVCLHHAYLDTQIRNTYTYYTYYV